MRSPGARSGTAVPPVKVTALLQGLVICGTCGERMSVRYHSHRNAKAYRPTGAVAAHCSGVRAVCVRPMHGGALDAAIGDIIIEAMTPLGDRSGTELCSRNSQAARRRPTGYAASTWSGRSYEAELAQRRFLKVDPDNRLVADALEADWNEKLRALAAAQEAYEKAEAADTERRDRHRACRTDGSGQLTSHDCGAIRARR